MKKFKSFKDIKVGVIGYGGSFDMGRHHIEAVKAAGMTPTAVADTDAMQTSAAKADYPEIETFGSLAAMLKNSAVNLVIVITPHNTHAKLACEALRAGRHVVCEKPLAVTTAQCDRMISAARRNKVLLSAYHNRHWDGCIIEALRHIRRGEIGEVFRLDAHMGAYARPGDWWRSSRTISGGILYDWGVHLIEYGLQIIDSDVVEVAGFAKTGHWSEHTRWGRDTIADEGYAVVRFSHGRWMTLCITQIDSNPRPGRVEITGTKGSYVFDGDWWRKIVHRGGKKVITEGKNPPGRWGRYYQNVAAVLTGKEKLIITPQWSRRTVHILDLAQRSAKRRRALKARYP